MHSRSRSLVFVTIVALSTLFVASNRSSANPVANDQSGTLYVTGPVGRIDIVSGGRQVTFTVMQTGTAAMLVGLCDIKTGVFKDLTTTDLAYDVVRLAMETGKSVVVFYTTIGTQHCAAIVRIESH
jgi:hypothetical protein